MRNVIDLCDLPDCDACTEPTKYIRGRTFDVDGPGVCGVLYDCENQQCRRIREAKAKFILRQGIRE